MKRDGERMWQDRERRKRGIESEIQCLAPETGTALAGSTWPGSGLVLDPAWPTAPPPRPPLRVLPLAPSPHLLFCNFLFLLSRQNAERERLVNEAHAHTLARTRSVPSSPFPCVAPTSPCLAAGLPPSALPSATASAARFFLRRRRGLKHNAPRRTA